jgi:mRNA interferase RelE/StbE
VSRTLSYAAAAERDLAAVEPKKIRRQILTRIEALLHDPTPPGYTKLVGRDDVYRVRQGDYRILYDFSADHVIVLEVGHRKNIYR